MYTYEERRKDWGTRMESIMESMMRERTEKGVAFAVNLTPLLSVFNKTLAEIDTARLSDKYILIPTMEEFE